MEWDNNIKTYISGMAGGESYYSLEDIYQEIKTRLTKDLKTTKPDVEVDRITSCPNCGRGFICDLHRDTHKCE